MTVLCGRRDGSREHTYVEQTTADVCFGITKIKVTMLNTAENLCIEGAPTAAVSLNIL